VPVARPLAGQQIAAPRIMASCLEGIGHDTATFAPNKYA
jgi:hypothetical protein